MQSIPAAMTWELLHRGRWSILLAIPGAVALPAMIIMALRHDGLIDWREPSMLLMHVVMVQICGLCCGASLFAWQGRISRLYAYPIRTSEIVAWRLLPAMVIVGLQMAVCIATLNLLFDLHWPISGPALITAVAFAAVMAVVWLTEKSVGWSLVAFGLVAAALGLWFKSRYGHAISDPTHFWDHVTPGDAVTMLAMTAGAYVVSIFAVARNRRGDPPLSIGLLDWLYRIFDISPAPTTRLGTPFRAQCWLEWQRNGWAMPGTVLVVAAFGTTVWALFDREALSLFTGFLGGGAVLQLLGCLGGVLFGNVGQSDDNHAMGHFRATRPISDADAARAILKTAAKSVLWAWSIWASALAVVYCIILLIGSRDAIHLPEASWWLFPATLLGLWMATGSIASVVLLGGSKYAFRIILGLILTVVTIMLVSKFLLTPAARLFVQQTSFFLLGSTLVVICVWSFIAARRRGFIEIATIWAAAMVWAVATVLTVIRWPPLVDSQAIGIVLIAGIASLIVTPLAAAPLALSANRHR
jgi:hypothetical protein